MQRMGRKVVIVGAGPVGLRLAALLKRAGIPATIVEASSFPGGQMSSLYPAKAMEDPPEFSGLSAKEAVERLVHEAEGQEVLYETRVVSFEPEGNGYSISLSDGKSLLADFLVMAIGKGTYRPRKLGLEGEGWARNILYKVKDPERFRGKKVVILGGGNAAIDWAHDLCDICSEIVLSHRRREFRGDIHRLDGKGISILTPFVPVGIDLEDKEVRTLRLKEGEGTKEEAIEGIDYLLVFYGIISENPDFPLPAPRSIDFQGYLHDEVQETARNLFVIGDCSLKDREEKRLLPGFREAAVVADEIKKRLS